MKLKKLLSVVIVLAVLATLFVGCKDKETEEIGGIVKYNEIENLPEKSVYLEWVGEESYNKYKPTMIFIHGETTFDDKTTISLDENSYFTKEADAQSDELDGYNIIAAGTGITAEPKHDLASYWIKKKYNVGILHWEAFADDSEDMLLKKLFTLPNMRYKNAEGVQTAVIPNHNLTEIATAAIIAQLPQEGVVSSELRFVANGIGCDLAISISDYMYNAYDKGYVAREVLPERLALCDPYLPATALGCEVGWRDIDETDGMLGVAEEMLGTLTARGLVVEMIESTSQTEETKPTSILKGEEVVNATLTYDTFKPEYKIEYTEAQQALRSTLIEKTAYLSFKQSFSKMFSTEYAKQKRIAADWYFYSIIGSDYSSVVSKNGKEYAVINNFGRNKSYAIYGVSAWTPTSYTRALRGIRFTTQTHNSSIATTDIHEVTTYENFNAYVASYFRSELFQCSENMNKTLVCGYLYNDRDGDGLMNDGALSGIGGIKLTAVLNYNSKPYNDNDITKSTLETVSGEDGFYCFSYDISLKDRSADASTDFTLMIIANSPSMNYVPSALPYPGTDYVKMSANNFTAGTLSNSDENELDPSLGGYIKLKNCFFTVKE